MVLFLSILGFVLLTVGAEWLVRGASRLAAILGINPLVVGLTVVAFATGSPELAVSLFSALVGKPDITVGNVVGSNILNVFFVLGLAAIVARRLLAQRSMRKDVLAMIAASFLLYGFSWDGVISKMEGILFLILILGYMTWLVKQAQRQRGAELARQAALPPDAVPQGKHPVLRSIALLLGGLGALVLGADWLVDGAVHLAHLFGISELIIGLTIVALGTSLPEVAASVMACTKGEQEIAIGNVVGSNIFNILAVVGASAIIAPQGIPVNHSAIVLDIPFMLMAALACLPLCFSTRGIHRWEGGVFIVFYGAYAAFLVVAAISPEVQKSLKATLWFIVPLALLTFIVMAWRASTRKSS